MNLNSREVNRSDIWIFHSKVFSSEYPMNTLLIFFLNYFFFDIVAKNQKAVY